MGKGLIMLNNGMNFTFLLLVLVVSDIVASLPLYVIAQKKGHDSPWLAFVPLVNAWLMCDLGDKEWYWLLFLMLPVINAIALALIWIAIAEEMDMPSWLGILVLVPIINLLVMYYIAFAAPSQVARY